MAIVKNEPETDADIVAQELDKFLSNPRVQDTKLVDMSTDDRLSALDQVCRAVRR